ncbi:MAG: hypothetical protein ACI9XO_003771 [Paraglaciecola sp.]|jgi:hypothetical protein
MKSLFVCYCILLAFTSANAQFQPTEKELMIMVSDGTDNGKNSNVVTPKDIPTSYDQVGGGKMTSKGGLAFTDPIRSLGMTDCIQAAAFLKRPVYGKLGYLLIFSVNDAIGGKQAVYTAPNGRTYQGVYRLVRQKSSSEEPTPAGMTNYKVIGTFFLLGIS